MVPTFYTFISKETRKPVPSSLGTPAHAPAE
jgi:hypothetical protein